MPIPASETKLPVIPFQSYPWPSIQAIADGTLVERGRVSKQTSR